MIFLFFHAIEISFYLKPLPSELNARLNNVADIHQDYEGYLWFASQDGLFRYDGYQIKPYQHDARDTNSIGANWTTKLEEDDQGNLWVGTFGGGLCRLDPNRTSFKRYYPNLPGSRHLSSVRALFLDSTDTLWVGLQHGGLLRREGEDFVPYIPDGDKPGALKPGRVIRIFEDSTGALWIGTSKGGLNRLAPGGTTFEHLYLPPPQPDAPPVVVWSSVSDGNGAFWLGTSAGLYHFDPREQRFEKGPIVAEDGHPMDRVAITELQVTPQGMVWGGTDGAGVFVFDPGTDRLLSFRHQEEKPGALPHNDVNVVFQDRTGLLWFGTLVGGVQKFDPASSAFNTLRRRPKEPNSLSDSFTKVIYEDEEGDFWIGGNNGIDRYNPRTGTYRHHSKDPDDSNTLSHNSVRAAVPGGDGDIWIGTWGGGLNLWKNKEQRFHRYYADPEIPESPNSNWIESLHMDPDGFLWLGTNLGLELRDGRTGFFKVFPTEFSDENDFTVRIRVIRELRPGSLYLGSNYGMAVIDRLTGASRYYRHQPGSSDSLANNTVRDILRGKDGTLWVATAAGLNKFYEESAAFTLFDEKDGLCNHVIYTLLEDDEGRLWIATNNGLSRYDPQTGIFTNFYAEDGLQGNEFNGGAALRTRDGRFFFGGVNGVTWFRPENVRSQGKPAEVVISEFKIFEEPANYRALRNKDGVIELAPDRNFLAFEFAGLDFRDPRRTRYIYRMDGVDSNWSQPDTRRYVNYPNLKPGNYTLRVKSANSGGAWSEKETTLPIHIETPLTQTLWVQVLGILFFLAPLAAWLHGLLRRKKVLEARVSARTISLERANKELERSHSKLQQAQAELMATAHQAGMTEIVNGVVHNLGNVLNSVGINAETLRHQLDNTRAGGVNRLVQLLEEHQDNLTEFLTEHPQGKKTVPYMKRLSELLDKERTKNMEALEHLIAGVEMMRDTVRMQQGYAKNATLRESLQLSAVVDDMIKMQLTALNRHAIEVERRFEETPPVTVQRFKLAHILTNLIRNAIDAISERKPDIRKISFDIAQKGDDIHLSVTDTGIGIDKENLEKVFKYGFTTKITGKGFGLHSCANSMKEMGGSLKVDSKGAGKGATFTLIFPKKPVKEIKTDSLG
ncbi:MAG: two-component regulator propeller domain-containing protein [Acidobacteriota bacterium]|nr:two-component regulator propeller domain-containing protein [Acidobacteriota bacterium]